jgi:5-(aminomethyl)-3-furanmethanol phosphate kinase
MTWVVKLGGSLNADPLLPQWLDVLTQLGGGRVVLVCGGGRFADAVRQHQAHWQFNDLAAHNMALLAMVQTAHFLHALNPALQMVSSDEHAQRVLRLGKTPLWSPLALLAEQADAGTNWKVTSDSVALALGQAGIVDAHFAPIAALGTVEVGFLPHDQPGRMRELLLGTPAPSQA